MAKGRVVAYRRLANDLRDQIMAGAFGENQPLPTEGNLALVHGVSRSTVRRAMQDLVAEGVIYRVAGRGTFPTSHRDHYLRHFGSVEDLMALSQDTEAEIVATLQRRVDIEAAGRLGLASDIVCALTFRRLYGDTPFALTTVSLPTDIGDLVSEVTDFTRLGARSRRTLIGSIEAALPGTIAETEQSITAVTASDEVAAHLDAARGAPLLRVDRLYSDETGTPVELAVSYFDPAYYTYRITLRRRP